MRGKINHDIHSTCSPNPFVGQQKKALKVYFMISSTVPWKILCQKIKTQVSDQVLLEVVSKTALTGIAYILELMKTEHTEILGALEFLERVELWLYSAKLKSFNLGYEFITIEYTCLES